MAQEIIKFTVLDGFSRPTPKNKIKKDIDYIY